MTDTSRRPRSGTEEPRRSYNFKLVIQGIDQGHFTYCSEIGASVQAIRYREGGENSLVRCLPGPVEYADVTLQYGMTSSRDLWDWFTQSRRGTAERKNVSIVLLDRDGVTPREQWNLINAWPSAWRAAPFDALSNQVAVASLTLVFEELEMG